MVTARLPRSGMEGGMAGAQGMTRGHMTRTLALMGLSCSRLSRLQLGHLGVDGSSVGAGVIL